MGGFGSGRRGNASKGVTSECPQIRISDFLANGLLSDGRCGTIHLVVNSENYTLGFRTEETAIVFKYFAVTESLANRLYVHTVTINWTNCNYGGFRAWFVCPSCSRQCGVLYIGPRELELGCRKCQNLCYRSQLNDVFDRTLRKVYRYRGRLGLHGTFLDREPLIRPRYMHNSKFLRILIEYLCESQKLKKLQSADLERCKQLGLLKN